MFPDFIETISILITTRFVRVNRAFITKYRVLKLIFCRKREITFNRKTGNEKLSALAYIFIVRERKFFLFSFEK